MKIVVLDNYDSFTFNLVQRLGELDPSLTIDVFRNDQVTVQQLADHHPTHLIISPGPCTPKEAGISVGAVQHFAGRIPLLGVCLGHQSIGQAYGGKIVRAPKLMHGKIDEIHHDGKGLFAGLDNPMIATRYHSLVIQPDTLSPDFMITATTQDEDGEPTIMGIQHREHPLYGLQFHPESFLTEQGPRLLQNFLTMSG